MKRTIKTWLDAKSETGTFLMGKDGPVTRREVLLVNGITIFIAGGALAADTSIVVSAVCIACAGVLVKWLNSPNNNQKHGK